MKNNILLFMMIIFMSCNQTNSTKNKPDKNTKKYHDLGNEVFGIDMRNFFSKNVISQMKSRGYKYVVSEESTPAKYPEYFESKYFIGKGIDKTKIKKVSYSFPVLTHASSTIDVNCEKDVYSKTVSMLKNKYGEPHKKINKNTGLQYLEWIANPASKSSINGIYVELQKDEVLIIVSRKPLSKEPSGH
jgi:hypothetical protein